MPAYAATSDAQRDALVIKALFAALCTSVPEDTRLEVVRNASLELKFLTAVQPRVSSFSHRRRRSLRHPALSMAVQRFYWAQRMSRPQEEPEGREGRAREIGGGTGEGQAERLDAMLADYASRGGGDAHSTTSGFDDGAGGSLPPGLVPGDGGYAGFASSLSGSLWHYRRISHMGGMAAADRSLSLSAASGGPRGGGFAQSGHSHRVSAAASESVMSVMRNAMSYGHLLEPSLAGSTAGGRGRGGSHASAGRGAGRKGKASASASGPPVPPVLGITRDPASAALGADMEEEEFVAYQQSEDLRWEQVAICYDQMLRAATNPCKVAALTAAANAMLNDVIRRYWDRVTVSPAAQERYQAMNGGASDDGSDGEEDEGRSSIASRSEEEVGEAGGSAGARRPPPPPEAGAEARGSADGLRGAQGKGRGGGAGKRKAGGRGRSTNRESPGPGAMAGRGKDTAAGAKGKGKTRLNASPGPSAAAPASAGASAKRTAAAVRRRGAGRGGGANTALYMSPMQYVYLNLRIAAVLLPAGNDLEVEMLDSVREDLLMDGTYSEDDPLLEHYFGKAPALVLPAGVAAPRNPNPPEERALPPPGGLRRAQRSVGLSPATRGHRWSDADGGGVAESLMPNSIAAAARSVVPYGRGGSPSTVGGEASPLWDPTRMPWLTYAQFWCSMMELVDNWTCSAVNPVECTIFLLELYGEAFGHDWDADDESYLETLRRRMDAVALAAAAGERAQESLDILASFNEMLEDLDDLSGSDSGIFMEKHFGNPDDEVAPPSPTRRRSTQRFSIVLGEEDEDGDSSDGSIDWSGRRRKDGWKYQRYQDTKTGLWKRRRRKMVLEPSKTAGERRRKAKPAAPKEGGEGSVSSRGSGRDGDSSEYSIFIIEEELNSDNEVTHRRRLHRHRKSGDAAKRKGRRPRGSQESSDAFMYRAARPRGEAGDGGGEADGGSRQLQRLYYDKPARRFRRLDNGEAKDDYLDTYDDNLSDNTSWSSFADGDEQGSGEDGEGWQPFRPLNTEIERSRRLRKRVRRTGPRSERRRYGREPSHFYRLNEAGGEGGEGTLSSFSESLSDSDFSFSVDEEVEVGAKGAAAVAPPTLTQKDPAEAITTEERDYLMQKKSWLQRTLGTKGVHIGDAAFADQDEEGVLLQLLRVTEQLVADAAAAGGSFEDDDTVGLANFDPALLAKLFAKPKAYTLEELQQSELMKALLAMGDEAGGQVPLTAAQMDGIVSALRAAGRSGGPRETASVRRRREQLIAEARRLQNILREDEQRRRAEEKAELRRQQAEAAGKQAAAADTFDLTATGAAGDRRTPASGGSGRGRSPRPSPGRPPRVGEDVDDEQLMTRTPVLTPAPPPPGRRGHSAGSLQRPITGEGDGAPAGPVDGLPALTRQERREQDRLFREFEAYCIEHAARNSKYRVAFTHYTPEQLEAFFNHLNLGSRQQALLRGRAPLAPATSTMGGTLHQERQRPNAFALGVETVTGALTRAPAAPLAPAPVKLFTLTAANTLEGAMQEHLQSYLEDRLYQASVGRVRPQARPTAGPRARGGPTREHTNGLPTARPPAAAQGAEVPATRPVAGGGSHDGGARAALVLPPLPGRSGSTTATAAAPTQTVVSRPGSGVGGPREGQGSSEQPPPTTAPPLSVRPPSGRRGSGGDRGRAGEVVEEAVTPATVMARAAAALEKYLAEDAAQSAAASALQSPPSRTGMPKPASGGPQTRRGRVPGSSQLKRPTSPASQPLLRSAGSRKAGKRSAPGERAEAPVTAAVEKPELKSPLSPPPVSAKHRPESMGSTSSRGLDDFEDDM